MTASLRIAVADDEPDMRDYFRKLLTRLGHKVVVVAADGRDLVAQCLAERPDLVITDFKMPHMDGIDAARRIYQERRMPIILVSACHDPSLPERAAADHIMAYLMKPIKRADLEPIIAQVIHRLEQQEALRKAAAELRQSPRPP
jgi:two-component system, response regulator PdtaR